MFGVLLAVRRLPCFYCCLICISLYILLYFNLPAFYCLFCLPIANCFCFTAVIVIAPVHYMLVVHYFSFNFGQIEGAHGWGDPLGRVRMGLLGEFSVLQTLMIGVYAPKAPYAHFGAVIASPIQPDDCFITWHRGKRSPP